MNSGGTMIGMKKIHLVGWLVLVGVAVNVSLVSNNRIPANGQQDNGAESEIAQIARSRGFVADEHKLVTADGYILNLVRLLNPLINNGHRGLVDKRPILFVPGESASGSIYLSGSEGIEPKDLSSLDIHDEHVRDSLAGEPSSRVLAFLSLNFGHEVWIFNRRGTPSSLRHLVYKAYTNNSTEIGSTTKSISNRCTSDDPEAGDYDANEELLLILGEYARESVDSRYWNYTLDQQARVDLPQAFNYVLTKTGQDKVALVGWSSGASLALMMLISEPWLNGMVSSAILLAPSLYRSPTASLSTNSVESALSKYIGPFNGRTHTTNQVKCLLKRACYATYGKTVCNAPNLTPPGRTGNRPTTVSVTYTPQELLHYAGHSTSASQTVQLKQNIGRPMHFYDFGDPARNYEAYGRKEPPAYDTTKITLSTISVWHGPFDQTANADEIDRLVGALKVPVDVHNFNASNLYFDHFSVVFHREVNTLINLPALEQIERIPNHSDLK